MKSRPNNQLPSGKKATEFSRQGVGTRIVVDVTRLRSILTGLQVFDYATGLAAQNPRDTRVALVVRPDQVQHANLVEKIARTDGVLLATFLNPEEAGLWVKRY